MSIPLEFLSVIIAIVTTSLSAIAIFFASFLLQRRRRQEKDSFASEASRWLEQANTSKTLGWDKPALLMVFVAFEQTLRGIADERKLEDIDVPLSRLTAKMQDEGILSEEEVYYIGRMSQVRNLIVHGQGENVTDDDVQESFDMLAALSERLLNM